MPHRNPSLCAIRTPEPRDYARMAELAGQLGYPCTAEELAARLDAMRDGSRYAVYVAELPGGERGAAIVGWIGLYLFRAVEVDTFAEISGLVVEETARSQGIGKRLIAAGEAWARTQGCAVLSVRANVTRSDAHRFYASNGFEHVKTQKTLRKRLASPHSI